MKKTITLLLIGFALSLSAQTNLDSLYSIWEDETQADSIRVAAYKDYLWKGFLFSQPDTTFILAEALYTYAADKNYPKAKSIAYNIQGLSHYLQSDYPKALRYYEQSLAIRKQLGNQNEIAISLNNIGIIYKVQGYSPKALEYFLQSLAVFKQLGNQNGIANSLNNIGIIYQDQGNYPEALDYLAQGLEIKKQLDNQNGIANALNNIGIIYKAQGDYLKALKYYEQSLEIVEELDDQEGIAISLSNIGAIYKVQGDYLKALEYYEQGLAIRTELGNQNGIAGSLNNIGTIYKVQGNYSKAIEYCQKGYRLAVLIEALSKQKEGCQCLYDTYKAMGKGNEALVYMEKMQVIDDSLNAEETAKKLQQMEFTKQLYTDSVETFEKELLVQLAHQEEMREEEKTRNLALGGGLLVLLLAGGLYGRVRYIRKSKARLQTEKDRSENLLLNILPADIAAELKEKGKADARDFERVSILFTDFKGFTEASAKLSAQDLVSEINTCFEAFDGIMGKYGIEKIKTIGDAYMAAGGLPVPSNDSAKNTVLAALEMQAFISQRKAELEAQNKPAFEMRLGVHTGPVVAGIVGVKKFQYDIWGDTVNTASRMESSGEVSKVNISQATYELLKNDPNFSFKSRGKIEAKGKGEIEMWFVEKA
jgi:class 3 adenylate cyclase/TPR repeat protein